MRDCHYEKDTWKSKLFPKLDSTLAERMQPFIEQHQDYEYIKKTMLKSVGATSIAFGQQVQEMNMDKLKHKTASQIIELLRKITEG